MRTDQRDTDRALQFWRTLYADWADALEQYIRAESTESMAEARTRLSQLAVIRPAAREMVGAYVEPGRPSRLLSQMRDKDT